MPRPTRVLTPPGAFTPEQEREQRATKQWQYSVKDWKDYKYNEAMLGELESKVGDEEGLLRDAYRAAKQEYPDLDFMGMDPTKRSELLQGTKQKVLEDYQGRVVGLRQALQTFIDQAGTTKPPRAFFDPKPEVPPTGEIRQGGEQAYDVREPHPPSIVRRAMHALGTPARMVSGAVAGATATMQEHVGAPEPTPRQPLLPGSPKTGGALVPSQGLTFGGVNWAEGAEKIFTGDVPIGELAKNVFEYVRGNVENTTLTHYQSLSSVLADGVKGYRDKVKGLVAEKFKAGEIQKEEIADTYKELMDTYLEQDPATKNPQLTQLMVELVGDPMWVVTPASVYKTLKKIPGIKGAILAAEKYGQETTEGFRFLGGQLDELRRAGNPQLAAEIEMAELQGQQLGRTIKQMSARELGIIKKLDKQDAQLLYEVRTGQTPMSEALYQFRQMGKAGKKRQEKFENAYEAAERLTAEHQFHGKASGVRMRREGEKLVESPDIPDYVPGRQKIRPEDAPEGMGVGQIEGRQTMEVSSAKERGLPPEAFTPDVALQFGKEMSTWTKEVEAAYKMRKAKAALVRHGHIIEVDNPATILQKAGVRTPGYGVETQMQLGERAVSKRVKKAPEEFAKMQQKEERLFNEVREQQAKVNDIMGAFRAAPEGGARQAREALGKAKEKLATSQNELASLQSKRKMYIASLEVQEEALRTAKQAEGALRETLQKMQAETGVEWGFMEANDKLHEIYTRITGMPLTVETGSKLHLMPKDAIRYMAALTPAWAKESHGIQSVYKTIDWALNKSLRPLNQVFRTGVTSAFPMYHVRNWQSNIMLGTVAHGFKMANPKLQGTTARLALLAGGLNSKKALSLPYQLPSGETVKVEQLLKMAAEDGVLSQFDILTQQRGAPIQELAKLSFAPEAAQKVSPQAMGNLGENYSKLLGYIGFLDGTDPGSRAKALKGMADYMGDYRRMGEFEKRVMTEIVPFYGWARFIVPYTARRLADSPAKIAAFQKAFEYNQRRLETLYPADPAAQDPMLEDLGRMLPGSIQSRAVKKYLKDGTIPKPGSDEYFTQLSEDPLTMGLTWVNQFESMFGKPGTREARERLVMNLSPLIVTVVESMSGRDFVSGEPITDWVGEPSKIFATDELERKEGAASVGTSHLGRLSERMLGRGISTYRKMQELFIEMGKPEAAINHAVLWAARNQMAGLENLAIGAKYGMEGLQKALPMFAGAEEDPLMSVLPGSSVRVVRPHEEEAYRRKEAGKLMESTYRQVQRRRGPRRRPVPPLED